MYPVDWMTTVLIRRGGRDEDGNPLPTTDHPVPGCMVGPRATRDPVDRSDVTETFVTLYGPPRMDVRSTDVLVVPDDHPMRGKYQVNGDPGYWPSGTEVPLRASA